MKVFGHEAHSDVQEDLLDAWGSQRGVQQRHQDLEDSRELPGDLRWSLNQSGFQQTHHALQLHIQLATEGGRSQLIKEKLRLSVLEHKMLMTLFRTP